MFPRVSRLVLLLLLAGASPAAAGPGPVAQKLALILEKGISGWTSVPKQAVRFLVAENSGEATAVGFPAAELAGFSSVAEATGARLLRLPLPPIDFFTACEKVDWGRTRPGPPRSGV